MSLACSAGGDGGRRSPEHSRISKEHGGRPSRCLGGPTIVAPTRTQGRNPVATRQCGGVFLLLSAGIWHRRKRRLTANLSAAPGESKIPGRPEAPRRGCPPAAGFSFGLTQSPSADRLFTDGSFGTLPSSERASTSSARIAWRSLDRRPLCARDHPCDDRGGIPQTSR